MITVLVTPEALTGDRAELAGDVHHHLFRVRRVAPGERLRVTDGAGRARWGRVERIDRRSATVTLAGEAPTHEAPVRVELLVAALRRERASWLVEKATEVGVAAVRFLVTGRTVRSLGAGDLERLRRVAAAAVEQCHRARLPEVDGPHPWSALPALLDGLAERWCLDEAAEAQAGPRSPAERPVALLVGPEGGWTPAEREDLTRFDCRPASLGPRVLRAETAAVVGAAMMLCGGGSGWKVDGSGGGSTPN